MEPQIVAFGLYDLIAMIGYFFCFSASLIGLGLLGLYLAGERFDYQE